MLSSPAEAVTGIAISSSSTERPECESSAESWPPPFPLPLPSETSETSFPSSRASRTSKPAGMGTRTQPSFKTSMVSVARPEASSAPDAASPLMCRS